MPNDNGSSANPFIRFKNEIDTHIAQFWGHGPRREAPLDSSSRSPDSRVESSSNIDPTSDAVVLANPPVDVIAAQLQQQRISSWLTFSAYSPDNLSFLPQPVPKDLLHDRLAGSCSTFHDAFADLLHVSSGHPLRDIIQALPVQGSRHYATSFSSLVFQAFRSQAWRASLQDQWDVYFPQRQARIDAETILEITYGLQKQQRQRGLGTSVTLLQSLIRQASMCEEEAKLCRLVGQPPFGPTDSLDSDRNDLWAVLRDLYQMNDPWRKESRSTQVHHEEVPDGGFTEKIDTEEALYQALCPPRPNSLARSMLPWDGTAVVPTPCANSFESGRETSSHVTEMNVVFLPDGSNIVTRVERHSHHGITEQIITTEKQDAQGLITERTIKTIQFPADHGGRPREHQASNDDRIKSASGRAAGTSDWFWTRRG
ncbi:hypothetical protein PFICI_15400 [Pestalotiopsis fici W106-1]|uniref:Uncharacterized protein n=1 Tax=Pestalotiopsis fici (strain W106-1 / CGMCC3.15140) TaxID=1229662 RepID=W3WG56_PESFW|nr:uncharacterized protein PFICI_15400 [Pestalotiopsis fici W106-1]ETS72893.1 hypothetical protein PFICI_15400 [Pestalotiopsis fici W106-1]